MPILATVITAKTVDYLRGGGFGLAVHAIVRGHQAVWHTAIFNSGQGSQFTRDASTGVLLNNGITISMDRYLLMQYLHFPHPCGSGPSPGIG